MLLGKDSASARAKFATFLMLLTGLTSCATVGHFSGAASGRITIPVIYRDPSANTSRIEDRPIGARIWLGAIPGEIYGPAHIPLKTEPVTNAPDFQLDLGGLRDIAEKQSAMLTIAASNSGWKISPAGTRLIRIATTLIYKQPHRIQPTTEFVDSHSGILLMLVFLDRPCKITGTIKAGASGYDKINVTVSEAGLHWLEVLGRESDPSHEVRHASGNVTPIFVATLPEN